MQALLVQVAAAGEDLLLGHAGHEAGIAHLADPLRILPASPGRPDGGLEVNVLLAAKPEDKVVPHAHGVPLDPAECSAWTRIRMLHVELGRWLLAGRQRTWCTVSTARRRG